MKISLLPLMLAGLLGSGLARAQTAIVPLDLPTCERVIAGHYGGRLPLAVDGQTVRKSVQCLPGVSKPVLIHHEDQVQESLSADELARMRPAVQRTGPDNALVRQRCAQPAFRALLALADVSFRLYAQDAELGTVLISADMCPPPAPARTARGDRRASAARQAS